MPPRPSTDEVNIGERVFGWCRPRSSKPVRGLETGSWWVRFPYAPAIHRRADAGPRDAVTQLDRASRDQALPLIRDRSRRRIGLVRATVKFPSLAKPHDPPDRWGAARELPDERATTRRSVGVRATGSHPAEPEVARPLGAASRAVGRHRFLGIRERRPPMSRSRLWMLAGIFAVGASGCAQCDSCNYPPVPCTGPGCSAALNVAPSPMEGTRMPAMSAAGGPFASPPPSNGTARLIAPALPDLPSEAASPPAGPAAPEKP